VKTVSENNRDPEKFISKVVIVDTLLKNEDLSYGGIIVKISTIDNRDSHHVFTVSMKPYL
jgi:hypothetical protein